MKIYIANFVVEADDVIFAKYASDLQTVHILFRDGKERILCFNKEADAKAMLQKLGTSR